MRPVGRLLIGCTVTLLWCYGMLLLGSTLDPDTMEHGLAAAGEQLGPPAPPPVFEMRQSRPISPDSFAAPSIQPNEQLERIEARQPLSAKAQAPVRPPHFARPGTVYAGALSFGSRGVRLRDVVPTELGRSCPSASGGTWPCGVMARTQQRLFIRNRAVGCNVDEKAWTGTTIASCSIGETDVAAWLVGNGWVEAAPGSPLVPLMEEAKAMRRGLFGEDPR